MSEIESILKNLQSEMASFKPKVSRIINNLKKARSKVLNEKAFYQIIGEVFNSNPGFFMTSIYPQYKMRKWESLEMVQFLFEKYSLMENEEILFHFPGNLKQTIYSYPYDGLKHSSMVGQGLTNIKRSATGGTLLITNQRLIAQGQLSVSGGHPNDLFEYPTGFTKRKRSKKELISDSISRDLPCYGYQFKRTPLFGIPKKLNPRAIVEYSTFNENFKPVTEKSIKEKRLKELDLNTITLDVPKDDIDNIFKTICTAEKIIDGFRILKGLGLNKKALGTLRNYMKLQFKRRFLNEVQSLWTLNDYDHLSISEKLDIIEALCDIDPDIFMKVIYPKMSKWNFKRFNEVKDDLLKRLKADYNEHANLQ